MIFKRPKTVSAALHRRRPSYDPLQQYADVVIQPGDACGGMPPSSSTYCTGFGWPTSPIDPSCGSINAYVDTSQLPAGVTLVNAPLTIGLTDYSYISIAVNQNAAPGSYLFGVGGTCTNSQHTGGAPGLAYWTLAIVQVDITDATASGNVITSPASLHDQVGAEESLAVRTTPSSAEPYIVNPNWQIPYNTSTQLQAYVDSYTQSPSSTSINSVTTTGTTLHFFPIAPYADSAKITFSASSASAGTAFHATTGFHIEAPTVEVTTGTGTVNIGNIAASFFPVLTPGYSDQSDSHGIQFNATFTSPSSIVQGQVGMTQLAGVNRWSQPSPPPGQPPPDEVLQSTYGFGLDGNEPQYGQNITPNAPAQVVLGGGSSASWQALDDPFQALRSCLDGVQAEDFFQDYFNFTPTPKPNYASIPVTVKYVSWEWEAYAQRPDGLSSSTSADWGQPGVWEQPTVTAMQSSTDLPQWYENALDTIRQEPVPCS